MWCVELTLSNEDDKQWIELATYLKGEIGEKHSSWTLGDFLTKAEQYEQAEEYYRLLEYTWPETGLDPAAIYNRIAYVRYEKKDYEIALDYLGKAKGCVQQDSEVDVITEFNQQTIVTEPPLAFLCVPGLRRRLEAYNVKTKYLVSNPASIPIIENNLGLVRYQQGHCEYALGHFEEALKILLKSELSFLPEVSAVYNNIGCVQYSKGNYDHAVDNFDKAMITLSKLDSRHSWIREYTENYQAASDRQTSNKPKRARAE